MTVKLLQFYYHTFLKINLLFYFEFWMVLEISFDICFCFLDESIILHQKNKENVIFHDVNRDQTKMKLHGKRGLGLYTHTKNIEHTE